MKKVLALVLALIMTLSLLPTAVWAEDTVFSYNDVEFYTWRDPDTGALGYTGDGVDGLEKFTHEHGTSVKVPFVSGEGMELYLRYVGGNSEYAKMDMVGGRLKENHTAEKPLYSFAPVAEGSDIYVLTLTDNVEESYSAFVAAQKSDGQEFSGVDIQFFAQSSGGGEQGGDSDEFVKVFEIGNTLVKIRNFEGQSNVLSFDKTTNHNGDPAIVVTIKTDDPELWRTVLNREDGLGVRFEIAAKEGTPDVRIHQVNGEENTLAQYIEAWSNNTSFSPYNDPHERNRGGEYATAVYDEVNGVTSILPITSTSTKTFGCSWKYGENDIRTDGFVFKVVIANNTLEFPVVVPDAAFVTTDRITAIPHTALDNLIKLKKSGDYVVCENGKVTYASASSINAENYAAFTAAVDAAVTDDRIGKNLDGKPMYNLLRVTIPEEGYVAKSYKGRFTALREYSNNSTAMDLEYMWNGFGCEQVYTLTWKHATNSAEPDIVEKLTIVSPSNPDLKWMDMIGERIPADENRVTYTALPADCGAQISYSNGTITTTFDNNAVLDVAPILESTVTLTVPVMDGRKAVAVKYAGDVGIMEDPADPTLTEFTATLINRFKGQVDNGNELNVENLNTVFVPLSPLREQTYGEKGEIKYFYSAHDGNRFLMLKWFFPDDGKDETPDVLYEYMEVEATPYLCKWETNLSTDLPNTVVDKPSAEVDTNANLSNIKLVTRIHPQDKGHGQYFFEMSVVDEGEGNTFIETYSGGYTIILPYSFIGVEDRAAAEATGKKAMINHYKNDGSFTLKDNNGTIFGTFTDRGIEFTVTDFSPFTVGLVEDTTPPHPGDDDDSFQYGGINITTGEKCMGLEVVTPDGGSGEVIVARYAGDATNAVLYLKPASGVTLKLPDDIEQPATLSGPVDGIYTLTVTEWNASVSLFLSNNSWIHFFFEKVSGGAPVTFTGTSTCGHSGVFFFSSLNENTNELSCGNDMMGSPEKVTVAGANQERKTIFLAASGGDTLSVSNATLRPMNGTWIFNAPEGFALVCKVYALDVVKPTDGNVVQYTVTRSWVDENDNPGNQSFPLIFDFTLEPGNGGGNQEDTTYWRTYETKYGNSADPEVAPVSKLTVRLNPLQAQVITLPEEINENNELIVTVHNATENNEAVWNELAQDKYGFNLGYFFESVEAEGESKPDVKSGGFSGPVSDALAWLSGAKFIGYNYNPAARQNGVSFAWKTAETDRTLIVPTTNSMTSAWVWRYDDGEGNYTEKGDGVIVKIVLDKTGEDAVNNAIVFENESVSVVDTERVTIKSYENLDDIFAASYSPNGVLTYRYTGTLSGGPGMSSNAVASREVTAAATNDGFTSSQGEAPSYPLLTVSAPSGGYTLKSVVCSSACADTFATAIGKASVDLVYHWSGLGKEQKYTVTWEDASQNQFVEELTISTPALADVTWMGHINGNATPVPDDYVIITQPGKDVSGAESSYSNGLLWTEFEENIKLDVDAVNSTQIAIKIPDGAIAYRGAAPGDGTDDPTLNENNEWMPEDFQGIVENSDKIKLDGEDYIEGVPISPLLGQNIGDIQYYYSGDRGTRFILIKWIFNEVDEDINAKYEYIQLDTESYYCQWKTDSKDSINDITNPVTQPTVVFARDDIKLVTRIHPQNAYGQYFFELNVVDDGQGNTFVIQQGDKFLIILPYSFMGEGWNYAKAQTLKEKPIINHYDKTYKQLQGNKGAIEGTYKPYGIEFEVDSFSPFKLTWTEETTTPSYPGYYNPIVSPEEKPVEKPTETKPVEKPVTPPVVEDDVTPAPEDNTPEVVPNEPPVIDDGAVDDAPAVDEPQGGNAGLWIGVGIVALAAIVAVLAIMAVRKKRK